MENEYEVANSISCGRNAKDELKCTKQRRDELSKKIELSEKSFDVLVNDFNNAPNRLVEPLIGWTYKNIKIAKEELANIKNTIKRLKQEIKQNKKNK